jgi:SAM-dependent methyltransferase
MRNAFLYAAGLVFLTLAKAKNVLRGYTSPKTFELSDAERCIAYDLKVVDEWLSYLKAYTGTDGSVRDQRVLELGPGSDLGVGVYLLAKGAAAYNACDVNDLMSSVPPSFYAALIERIGAREGAAATASLGDEIKGARAGEPSRLRLAVREDFDLAAAFGANSIDLVFSQAAFEHFDDVVKTVRQLSDVCKPGAIIVAEIDLKTHSRWIRDKDPNNIYRYSEGVYGIFRFRGTPNRVRPYRYREIFEAHGWTEVSITPIERLREPLERFAAHTAFQHPRNQLEFLSVVLCARKAQDPAPLTASPAQAPR